MSDGQGRKSELHDSAYLAEYHNLRARACGTSLNAQDDAKIYTSAFKDQLETYSPLDHHGEHLVILDVGTGAGRVLVNLADHAVRENIPLTNVEFLGVDKEPAMIHRAMSAQQQARSMSQVGRIDWLVGEALHLTSSELLENHINKVDLLLFAGGSVSHLISPNEPLGFFAQAAALLRPRSGRFYLSVRNDLTSTQLSPQPTKGSTTGVDVHDQCDFPSKLYDGIVYRQLPIESSVVDGPIKTDRYLLQVVKRTDAGGEDIIEENRIETVLRVFREPELLEWFKEAGLEFVEALHTSYETYYVLKQAD
ncbi:class I SAM-dependent methyltransferase [Aspergillus alliaceus]|uniref:class I SAM-dependent methyltransferase n=1 Tax=Petromyces alliaceus TaxID=209559 RepID=UPI0012A52381|nr:uncharacterized protein BDW43DRAFT_269275 [Aspergillus alliaceus]KAB8235620.1 hypothetical protein BDW43DRAFT_269275 [Aspergillus alliaceus]